MEDGGKVREGLLERPSLELRLYGQKDQPWKNRGKSSPDKRNSQCEDQMMRMNLACPGLGTQVIESKGTGISDDMGSGR